MKKLLLLSLAPLLTFAASPIAVKFSIDENAEKGKIFVSVTNQSKQDIEILKWNTPFEKTINADIFDVNMGERENRYIGRSVKRAKPTQNDYMLLEAGETEKVMVTLPTYYKMREKGKYTVRFDGEFKYRLLDDAKLEVNEMRKKQLPAIDFSFTPSTKEKRTLWLKKPAKFNQCSQSEIETLKVAHDDAIKISKESMDVLMSAPKKTSSERYVTWFGAVDATRQKTVTEGFKKIYDAFENKNITFDCGTCKQDSSLYDETYAYVYPDSQYQVYLCGAFWNSSRTGTDTQAGTLVHEVSHFTVVVGANDYAYGQEDAKTLAKNSPQKAINNAENYDYFAENNPNLSMDRDEEANNPEPDNNSSEENNDSESTENVDDTLYDANEEDKALDLCFELIDDTEFEACLLAWESKYYADDENSDDWGDPLDESWYDDELNWDDIDWYAKSKN